MTNKARIVVVKGKTGSSDITDAGEIVNTAVDKAGMNDNNATVYYDSQIGYENEPAFSDLNQSLESGSDGEDEIQLVLFFLPIKI